MSNCFFPFNSILSPEIYGVIVVTASVMLIAYVKYGLKLSGPRYYIGASLMLAGAIFNALERSLNQGCVNDYIDFGGVVYFNVYDIMVCIGVTLLIIEVLKELIWKRK